MEKQMTSLGLTALFQNCAEKDLEKISRILVPKNFAADEIIMRQGDPSRGFFLIRSGAVHVHRLNAEGQERLIRIFHAPESFAEASLFPHGKYPAFGRAIGDVAIWLVPKDAFVGLLGNNPELAVTLIASLSKRIHSLVDQWENFRFGTARERLCQWLLLRDPQRPQTMGFSVHLPTTKAEWAEELGIRQETLSRLLRKLQSEKILQVHGKEIFIPDRGRLGSLAA